MRWIGARLRCASATMATMRASMVSAPILSARTMSDPVPLTVPPMRLAPVRLATGIDSGDHGLDGAVTLKHGTVDWHTVPRMHAKSVADLHLFQCNFLI